MKQKKIIVPIDFTENSQWALDTAVEFARLHDSEIILTHVVEPVAAIWEFFAETDMTQNAREAAVKKLAIWQHKAEETGARCSIMIESGKPYKGILKAADEVMAEMIVLGTRGSAHDHDGALGSNANKVIRGAECPVITVNEPPKSKDLGRITVPVDYEFGIRELRSLLQQYSKTYNPVVDIVTVLPAKGADEDTHKMLTSYLEKQKQTLQKQGINEVETHLIEGKTVGEALLDHANAHQSDMIWMETHGRAGLSNLLMGSITEEVIGNAHIPVLSLKPIRKPDKTWYYHQNMPI